MCEPRMGYALSIINDYYYFTVVKMFGSFILLFYFILFENGEESNKIKTKSCEGNYQGKNNGTILLTKQFCQK